MAQLQVGPTRQLLFILFQINVLVEFSAKDYIYENEV